MKRLLLLTMIVLPLAACGGSADFSTPEGAAAAYLEADMDEDKSELYEAIVKTEADTMKKSDTRAEERGREGLELSSNLVEYVVQGSEIAGNRAVVTVLATREFGDKEVQKEEFVVCLRTDGEWKVSMSGTKHENSRAPIVATQ